MNALEIVGLEWLGALALFLGFIVLVRYLDHRERMAMIDRGLMPPHRMQPRLARQGSAALRGGLITAMVGVALTIGLYALGYVLPEPFSAIPGKLGPWLLPGLIPLGIGAALVASHYLAPPRPLDNPSTGEHPAADAAVTRDLPGPPARAEWRLLGRGGAEPEPADPAE